MIELSVLIPGRNEEFMQQTIDDVLRNSGERTEVIAILDGYIPKPPLKSTDSRLTIIYNPEAKGQRIAANQGAKLAKGKYLMKIDAHCAFDKDFDVKMLQAFKEVGDDVTMVPIMRNLHAFDWVCPNGHRRYQSPSGPCTECGKPTVKDIVWIAKTSPQSVSYRFDKTPHFQYWGEWGKMQKGDITETMSLQGSCFMCTKERYFALGLCGEEFNSWGQQGMEVACKTWLSGGRVLVNRRTWYAHMFRTQGGDFGFPYHQDSHAVNENRRLSRDLFVNDKWPLATRKFQWMLDHFNPPDWGMTKGIIYYTDNELEKNMAEAVRNQLLKCSEEKKVPITSASIKGRLNFGVKNVHFPSLKRGHLTMFKQILGALENCPHDIVFFCEHDVLYHPSHFDFTPPRKDTYYYDTNVWQLRYDDGHCLYYYCHKLSQMVCYRDLAIEHYRKKIKIVEANKGIYHGNLGFEPGTRNTHSGGVDDSPCSDFTSPYPNVDIRHSKTLSRSKWNVDEFVNSKHRNKAAETWKESDEIPGWGKGIDIIKLLT